MSKRVLVQAGHIAPREPGFEGGTGTRGEQELVRDIRDRLVNLLNADARFDPIAAPGDIPDGIDVDAALFLHADGSSNPRATGYSFGYPNYAVNKRLADLIAAEFMGLDGEPPHHTDNYTGALRGYYGYSRADTPGPEVLVEHGFLTNPREAAWLRSHTGELAQAHYRALLRYFGFGPVKPKTRIRYALWAELPGGKIVRWKSHSPAAVLHRWNVQRHRALRFGGERI